MAPSEPTALALLDAYLNLLRYSPNSTTWSTEAFADNRFRSVCYRRVQALARAVEVPLTLFTLPEYSDEFFGTRPDHSYEPLLLEIEFYLTATGQEKTSSYDLRMEIVAPKNKDKHEQAVKALFLQDLATIFTRYLKFLEQLQKLQGFNIDWLMASSAGARFSIGTTNAIAASLDQPAIDGLRQFLARLIDPEGHCYTEAELVARFDYPTEDMARLEADSL